MSYLERERKRCISLRNELFDDPGGGIYRKKPREFVLKDNMQNFWKNIRNDVLQYFEENQIVWWGDQNNQPTGHLLSSQVACINHLFFLRNFKPAASEILRKIHPQITEAILLDSGFVEFEAVGKKNYLGEKSHTRGANATSIDALMVGKKDSGSNILVLIEWKYTESYRTDNKYIPARAAIYDRLLSQPDCPIKVNSLESLYYEPFYQLMRQTLLGWKMVQAQEYGCDEYIHLHIIPTKNVQLRDRVTSPDLRGNSLSEAWKNVLVQPDRYIVLSPDEFLAPLQDINETHTLHAYLKKRYWG